MNHSLGATTRAPDPEGLARQCPNCGETAPEAALDGRGTNFLCHRCGTCVSIRAGVLWTVDPLTCPGCRLRDFCHSVISPLARSLSFNVTLRSGMALTIRPVVHSDLPSICGLAAKARAETKMSRSADIAARAFGEVRDVDPDHFCWVALARIGAREAPIAVATYRKCEDRKTSACAIVAVDSGYRRQGLGTVLYAKLAESARTHGIQSFRAQLTLPTEDAVRTLVLRPAGFRITLLGNHRLQVECDVGASHTQDDHLADLFALISSA
jgi:GNAT superfamily N-acetyltransferase